jgi:hypothetical protein
MFDSPEERGDPENSLMVVTTREEYCFLWDPDCLPELVESLLGYGEPPDDAAAFVALPAAETRADRPLTIDHFRSVVRELLARRYQEL